MSLANANSRNTHLPPEEPGAWEQFRIRASNAAKTAGTYMTYAGLGCLGIGTVGAFFAASSIANPYLLFGGAAAYTATGASFSGIVSGMAFGAGTVVAGAGALGALNGYLDDEPVAKWERLMALRKRQQNFQTAQLGDMLNQGQNPLLPPAPDMGQQTNLPDNFQPTPGLPPGAGLNGGMGPMNQPGGRAPRT